MVGGGCDESLVCSLRLDFFLVAIGLASQKPVTVDRQTRPRMIVTAFDLFVSMFQIRPSVAITLRSA
jgi:hypothetical protein